MSLTDDLSNNSFNFTQVVMANLPDLCLYDEEAEISDMKLLVAFNELRHREKIEGSKKVTQTWRMKERVSCHSVKLFTAAKS